MAELLNTGMRIRHFRILCGMTQKALGIAVGFSQDSADVRIRRKDAETKPVVPNSKGARRFSLGACHSPYKKQRRITLSIGCAGGRVRY